MRRADVVVAGIALVADCAGALYWPEEGLLVVADLHLEKGSSFATRGVLLPPYDTAATLAKLGALIARYAPRFGGRARRQFPRWRRAGSACRTTIAPCSARCSAAATGSGSPAITIPSRCAISAAFRRRCSAIGAAGVPSCAGARGSRRRDRRPSASGGAGERARAHGVAPLLRDRRQAHGDAGVRRLYRRPQYARRRFRRRVRHAANSPRICWAKGGSTPSRRAVALATRLPDQSRRKITRAEPAGGEGHHRGDQPEEQAVGCARSR